MSGSKKQAKNQPKGGAPRSGGNRGAGPPIKGGKAEGQHASYFCLENEHWRIIALDTGYRSIGIPVLEYFWEPRS